MSEREKKLIRAARTARLAFKEDESRQAWLPLLLEANAIVDAGVSEAIHRDEKQGRMLACPRAAPPVAAATPPSRSIRSNSSGLPGTRLRKLRARCASSLNSSCAITKRASPARCR